MIRSVPKPAWFVLIGLAVLAELNNILGAIAVQAVRITATLQHHALPICIGAAILGLLVYISPWHKGHGWMILEGSLVFLIGAALIPSLYPHLQTIAAGPLPTVINSLLNALVAGLAGFGV